MWPERSIEWTRVQPGDQVSLEAAGPHPDAQSGYVIVRKSDRKAYVATWQTSEARTAQELLDLWAQAGVCTRTKTEALDRIRARKREEFMEAWTRQKLAVPQKTKTGRARPSPAAADSHAVRTARKSRNRKES